MSIELERLRRANGVEDFLKQFWGFGSRPCLIGAVLIRASRATIVKPDFGELALTNRGGLINPVLTLPSCEPRCSLGLGGCNFVFLGECYECVCGGG